MKLFHGIIAIFIAGGVVPAQNATTEPIKIAKKESVKVVKGVIVFVNTAASTIIIKGWQSEDTIVINEKTDIAADIEKAGTFADFKVADRVTAFYKLEQGNKVALQIFEKTAMPFTPAPDSGNIGNIK